MYKVTEEIINDMSNVTDDYINSIDNRYTDFINYTQLPMVYKVESIDTNKLPSKTKGFLGTVKQIIDNRYSGCIRLTSYLEAGFLTGMFIDEYFKQCIKEDTSINRILYIDTNLLLSDYKKIMDKGSVSELKLVHNEEVLYKYIYEAEFVFWDKFTMFQSNYDISKLYDILSIRYRNCLGNLFFINKPIKSMSEQMSLELSNVMGVAVELDFENEVYKHIK